MPWKESHVYFSVPSARTQVHRSRVLRAPLMARHAGGPAPVRPSPPQTPDAPRSIESEDRPATPEPSLRVREFPADGVDEERYERMRSRKIRSRASDEVRSAALEAAARFQASREFVSESVDRESVSALTHFLIYSHHETGVVDLYRALRRPNVTRYLASRKSASPRTVRYHLHSAGRVLHPAEFPSGNGDVMYRGELTPPATADEIRALYAAAAVLDTKWRRILLLILDLVLACGARVSELKWLQRSDFRCELIEGHKVLIITLSTSKTPARQVPIVDPVRARTVMDLVDAAPRDRLMDFGGSEKEDRNATNRVNEKLRTKGLACRLNVYALRSTWMVEQARSLPLDEFCAIADIVDIRGVRAIMTPSKPSLQQLASLLIDAHERSAQADHVI